MVVRRVFIGLACALVAAGCADILGAGFDEAKPDPVQVVVDPPKPGTCPRGEKWCGSACVREDDPAFGCAGSCEPCSPPFASAAQCKAGQCAVRRCEAGRADCDGNLDNGCETSLLRKASCGACGLACAADEVCTAGGCAKSCPAGTTSCDGACVDLATDPDHCGACGASCAAPGNGARACVAGACRTECLAGFADCDGNPATCERLSRFFDDADGDGYGTTEQKACAKAPKLADSPGDCDDTDSRAHPGQTARFGAPRLVDDGKGGKRPSFDFDCDGVESRDPAVAVQPTPLVCPSDGGVSVGVPAGGRAGAGVDPYCGERYRTACVLTVSGFCACQPLAEIDPVACR